MRPLTHGDNLATVRATVAIAVFIALAAVLILSLPLLANAPVPASTSGVVPAHKTLAGSSSTEAGAVQLANGDPASVERPQ